MKTSMSSITTISIIGSAGRNDDAPKMTKELFQVMVSKAKGEILSLLEEKSETNYTLVSGGAAWADHVAVRLYLEGFCENLTLHFPARWDKNKFDNASKDGFMSNKYHTAFSARMKVDTLSEISQAIEKGAKVITYNGFFLRNKEVAKSDVILAFSWAENESEISGGTGYTWSLAKGKKIHIPLSSL